MRVLIVGIGALGGTIAARAINAGVPVRIDESTAHKYWPTRDPLGRRVRCVVCRPGLAQLLRLGIVQSEFQ